MYRCDFGIDISITHVCILMEELFLNFKELNLDFKGHFGKNSKSYQ